MTTRQLPKSNQLIQDFLNGRRPEDLYASVEGDVRVALKKEVFPLLTQKQQARFRVDDFKFNAWMTDTLRQRRGFVIQPEKTDTNKFVPRDVGQDNGLSVASLKEQNQRPHIIAAKGRHQKKHPFCWRKYRGTASLNASRAKYKAGDKSKQTYARHKLLLQSRRLADLECELVPRTPTMTEEERGDFIDEIYNRVGYLPEFPERSIKWLVENGYIVTYFGLVPTTDRYEIERLRFLVGKEDSNRPVLQWKQDGSLPVLIEWDDAIDMLGFKTALLYKNASHCGMESYMVERGFQQHQDDLELGEQRLNRIVGAGSPCRDKAGVYRVFLTYAETAVLKKHLDRLVIVE